MGPVLASMTRRLHPDEITREKEHARILASFELFSVPDDERAEILEALKPVEQRRREALDRGEDPDLVPDWDWFRDCDGCTCVSEDFWPTKYFPPCLRHDFDWAVGNPIFRSNGRFYRLSRRYQLTKARAGLRWFGVTAAWFLYFRWTPRNRARRRALKAAQR